MFLTTMDISIILRLKLSKDSMEVTNGIREKYLYGRKL